MTAPRVVSLLASATEAVCAMGWQSLLIGRSHECDWPPAILDRPICSEALISSDLDSVAIDQAVKLQLRNALSIYRVKGELLRRLKPDLILTQSQCKVCAVSLEDVEKALAKSWDSEFRPMVISLEPHCLADVWQDFVGIAEACGDRQRGISLVEQCQREMDAVANQYSGRPAPRVAMIEWIEPLMAAGNWIPEMLNLLGANSLFGEAGAHSPWMSFEQLKASDPDVIVVAPCGFSEQKILTEMHWLESRPDWRTLRAVAQGRVRILDGNQYFNRSGPRLVESLRLLGEAIYL